MNNDVYLVFNKYVSIREPDVVSIKNELLKNNFNGVVVESHNLYSRDPAHVPYGIMNFSQYPNESLYRYIREMEFRGSRVISPIKNIKIADNKMSAHIELKYAGIPVPKTIDLNLSVGYDNYVDYIEKEIGFPCVIKVPSAAMGSGIHLIKDIQECRDLLILLRQCIGLLPDGHSPINMIVQEYVAKKPGYDIRAIILNGEFILAMSRYNPTNWKTRRTDAKIVIREHITLDPEVVKMCIRVNEILGINFSGLDLLVGDNGILVNEVNTFPGMFRVDEVCKTNVVKLITEYLINK